MLRRVVALGFVLTLLSQSVVAGAEAHSLAVMIQDPSFRAAVVDSDLRFRRALHLNSDAAYVESLYSDLSLTVGHRRNGALFTPEENAEVVLRASLEDDAMLVEAAMSDSPLYAGFFLDNAAGGQLVILLTSPDAADAIPLTSHAERISVRVVEHSLADVMAKYEAIGDAFLQGLPAAADIREVEASAPRNSVVVTFAKDSPSAALVQAGRTPPDFAQAFGTDAVEFEIAPTTGDGALYNSIDCTPDAPPLWGGYGWGYLTYDCTGRDQYNPGLPLQSDSLCSIGFQMDKAGDSDTDYALSAGHCVHEENLGIDIYHRYVDIGSLSEFKYYGSSHKDLSLLRIPNQNHIRDDVQHDLQAVDVNGVQTSNGYGFHRCFTGSLTWMTDCGVITGSPLITSFCLQSDQPLYDMIRVEELNLGPTDSGGPLYRYVDAENRARAVATEVCEYPVMPVSSDKQYLQLVTAVPAAWDVTVSVDD